MRGLLETRLKEKIAELRKSGASDKDIATEKKKYNLELGENIGPITEFGQNYSRTQLYRLFRYVGRYCLGLPAFGPNILRSMHVTAVLIKAIKAGKKYDDPEIKDIFALARHGLFYREKTYNMVKADLDAAGGKTFVGQNRGLSGTIGEDGESEANEEAESTRSCEHFLELFEGEGFGKLQKAHAATDIVPALKSFFGPRDMALFIQQIVVAVRAAEGTGPTICSNNQEFVADQKRLEALQQQVREIEIKREIADEKKKLEELLAQGPEVAVTGKKRPASAPVVKVPVKRERLERSTDESDAVKLEILREMHALYVAEVAKECILPSVKELKPGRKKKLFVGEDPKKDLKYKLRRGKPSILCVPLVREFLGGFNSDLCDRFGTAFGGKGDNVNALIARVAKNKELPTFVWKDAVLSTCGKDECRYCD